MGSINGEESVDWDAQDSSAQEEKIFVAIRLRPLNERELAKNDVSDWECINNTTIIFKNTLQERSLLPTAYTFDRVFGFDASTRQVYEEAAKKISLSVLSGMNSTIFAYGQTSSGKTYTMTGITEYAIADIYDYIDKHFEREFVLKFSAMEIYNESVRDLLCIDGTPLRLLDDPERGTVVDKLTEVTLRDSDHLRELLSVCEAQRQIGETTLNEMSSRSHQILRLTVESEARSYLGAENSSTVTASVNFVDLAGSERASQTLSAEGCHINRSLLTLGTVIRKLSKGRNGHIPYRDSKLTRILQNSLGGNARTAIICTMSPAHGHLEQSRNTLLFASCAKQVSTNAQVNVVMSEKALVKQLHKELARLENELRNLSSLSASCASASALKEKELLIEKMDKEIRDLTHQRDLAQSRLEDLLLAGGQHRASKSWVDMNNNGKSPYTDEYSASEASEIIDPIRHDVSSRASYISDKYDPVISSRIEDQFPENNEEQFLSDNTSPRLYIDKYFGPDPCQGWEKIAQETDKNFEDNCKEVQCIEIDFSKRNVVSSEPSPENGYHVSGKSPCSSDNDASDSGIQVPRSKSCAAILTTVVNSPSSKEEKDNETTLQNEADNQGRLSNVETAADRKTVSRDESESDSMNEEEQNITTMNEDYADKQQETYVKEVKEVIKTKSVKQVQRDLEMKEERKPDSEEETADGCSGKTQDRKQSASDWHAEFERQKREIIELWDVCCIPLVHRTYFLLLFKGDPSDAVYMEVELRRLSFLKNSIRGGVSVEKDDRIFTQASSKKALNREREMLSKRMLKKFTEKEREALYEKWGIDVKSKQRRLQLCRRLWTDTTNMEHINDSAAIVAKLVGFKEAGQAPKEMFGLSFSPKPVTSLSWRHSLPSMM
ncbi:Kinesin-like protein [Handroanthus impetiginosus]|uniref:Kinesin-like protein n=1 Tax=Handroanthus impetiginosus TaxID=429701 RepID=A0A2G9I2C4_9LAMI|nr:Kinesin-like protein [Handroanthus impetiginosus]